jgi:hypothetical protein
LTAASLRIVAEPDPLVLPAWVRARFYSSDVQLWAGGGGRWRWKPGAASHAALLSELLRLDCIHEGDSDATISRALLLGAAPGSSGLVRAPPELSLLPRAAALSCALRLAAHGGGGGSSPPVRLSPPHFPLCVRVYELPNIASRCLVLGPSQYVDVQVGGLRACADPLALAAAVSWAARLSSGLSVARAAAAVLSTSIEAPAAALERGSLWAPRALARLPSTRRAGRWHQSRRLGRCGCLQLLSNEESRCAR